MREVNMAAGATDRFDLVRLFLRVAETGQVSEAARALGLSQPTASRGLKRLEEIVGARLVDRSPQGLSLTEAGRDFLAPARRLVDGWHEAVDVAKGEKARVSGTIRVAVPLAIGQGFLAAIAARFLRAHPEVAIEWHLRDDAVDPTAEGYDLWIRAGEVGRDDLVVRHVYCVERAIVAADGHAVSHPRELQRLPAVRLSTFVPGTVELTDDGGSSYKLRQRAAFTTDNLYAALTAALGGVGYAVLPLWCMH
ncbi:LysR family transcriptional regulator, partial [Jatrophihabitans endophyticus]|uniref:LysR family transcriptional regulator n=1 Tax=Jatrophihabitans endophyticus TaxID=1206085 RepID=UPI001A00BB1A